MTTAHFSSRARMQRSRSAASRGSLYFAWGCFRDFLSRPCRAPPKGRYAGSGTRDRQCLALTGPIDPVPTHHALERFQAKACPGLDPGWRPVRVKKTRQVKNPEPRFDSIETGLWLLVLSRRTAERNTCG